MKSFLVAALPVACHSAVDADLVDRIPGFNKTSFKAYSGMLDVPGPLNGYDSLKIHYQFHTAQEDAASKPVVAWHQGGPGGSSITGAYLEMGYFQVSADGTYVNDFAWNRVANMLFFESPAGSGQNAGYSQCIQGGQPVDCSWNDRSQAEAYAHTLQAFFKAYPEFSKNDFYLSGESYFGQYGPNIAHYILNNSPFSSSINLQGMLVGNGCWGGDENTANCNGPNAEQNEVELYFGKGLFSPKLYKQIQSTCKWPNVDSACRDLIYKMRDQVGPHDVYDIYDNCPQTSQFLERTGKNMQWLSTFVREGLSNPVKTHNQLLGMSGGFPYSCKSIGGVGDWLVRSDVQKALNLANYKPGSSGFDYSNVGPASITLYPELAKKIRILIYNGDADSCVPYNGNEEWIGDLEQQGVLKESSAWKPWYTSNQATAAGYVTQYSVPGSEQTLEFKTIRLAGHMVPMFMPEAGFAMFKDFLAAGRVAMV